MQEYINYGIKFGQDVAELNLEAQEVQKMIAENTPVEEVKEVTKEVKTKK